MAGIRWLIVATAALGLLGVGVAHAQNADKPISNLRLAVDTTGQPATPISEPPEKAYRLPAGTSEFIVAFEFQGSEPTDVAVRVLGPMGTIEFTEQKTYSQPGTQVIVFRKGDGALADNEYVVNAYVGKEQYLTDSLQLAVGEAQIPPSRTTELALTPQPTTGGLLPTQVAGAPGNFGDQPTGDPTWLPLALAVVGLVALGGVVLWAVRSAMRPNGG
jgi:hypothetical protein